MEETAIRKILRMFTSGGFPFAAAIAFAPSVPFAQEPNNSPYHVECRAPFARTASHAELTALYGAENVTFETVIREGGEEARATVLFGEDPSRRLEIEWYDEEQRRRPNTITVFGESNRWVGPLGIRTGMTIQEIEARAGSPFTINGFGFDVEGAGHFADTKLETLPGGCGFGGYFSIEGGMPPANLKRFSGEIEIDSNDPDLLPLKPKLWIYTLTYPPQEMD